MKMRVPVVILSGLMLAQPAFSSSMGAGDRSAARPVPPKVASQKRKPVTPVDRPAEPVKPTLKSPQEKDREQREKQQAMQQLQKKHEMQSNLSKSQHETAQGVIRNLR